jgi:hypothetical protein
LENSDEENGILMASQLKPAENLIGVILSTRINTEPRIGAFNVNKPMLSSNRKGKGVRHTGERLSNSRLVPGTPGHFISKFYGLVATTCGAGLLT